MCALTLERETTRESCLHADVETLGSDANAVFVRCKLCSQILVLQGGRVWTIRPPQSPVIAIRGTAKSSRA